MNELIVLKDVLYAAKIGGSTISGINEVNQLAAGAVAVFTDKNELVTSSNYATIMINRKSVYFALGSGSATTGAKISQPVDRDSANIEYKYYTAPVKQVVLVGDDGVVSGASMNIATPVAGTIAYLRIIDTTDTNINLIRSERYSYTVVTGDTADDVVVGLVAAANANADSKYTTTSVNSNDGFTVAANDYGQTFEVALDGIVSAATITTDGTGASTVIEFGSGTSDEVTLIESEFNSEDGNTSRAWLANKYYSKASDVVSGAHYDLQNIQWKQTHSGPIKTIAAADKQIIVALVTAPTTFLPATWHNIMVAAFGTAAANSEAGS